MEVVEPQETRPGFKDAQEGLRAVKVGALIISDNGYGLGRGTELAAEMSQLFEEKGNGAWPPQIARGAVEIEKTIRYEAIVADSPKDELEQGACLTDAADTLDAEQTVRVEQSIELLDFTHSSKKLGCEWRTIEFRGERADLQRAGSASGPVNIIEADVTDTFQQVISKPMERHVVNPTEQAVRASRNQDLFTVRSTFNPRSDINGAAMKVVGLFDRFARV